ncbi:MAG: hypothetical protein DCC67_20240, partial [Planctomycetota bacterium]
GATDAFLIKYNAAGVEQWTRQFGTASADEAWEVSADAQGNVYVAGATESALGGLHAGSADAFVRKYDTGGNLQWTKQLGTPAEDRATGVAVDGLGNVFLSGFTVGSLGGPNAGAADAFISRLDTAGNLVWTRQLGTAANDVSWAISADGAGQAYTVGYTGGNLNGNTAGFIDAFLTKYDSAGDIVWVEQFGTDSLDQALGVAADAAGNAYVTGLTLGDLQGSRFGADDAFLRKYSNPVGNSADYDDDADVDGNDLLIWQRGLGASGSGLLADGNGDGQVDAADYQLWRDQFGTSGATGVALAVPEPQAVLLAMAGIVALALRRR